MSKSVSCDTTTPVEDVKRAVSVVELEGRMLRIEHELKDTQTTMLVCRQILSLARSYVPKSELPDNTKRGIGNVLRLVQCDIDQCQSAIRELVSLFDNNSPALSLLDNTSKN